MADQSPVAADRAPSDSLLRLAGPGLIVAATGIGSGDVVSATVGGARYGVVLLWAIAVGAFFKFVLTEGIGRWQLATGLTVVEGWAEYLPRWVRLYFGAYLLFWTVAVSAALTNATGLGIGFHRRHRETCDSRGCSAKPTVLLPNYHALRVFYKQSMSHW